MTADATNPREPCEIPREIPIESRGGEEALPDVLKRLSALRKQHMALREECQSRYDSWKAQNKALFDDYDQTKSTMEALESEIDRRVLEIHGRGDPIGVPGVSVRKLKRIEYDLSQAINKAIEMGRVDLLRLHPKGFDALAAENGFDFVTIVTSESVSLPGDIDRALAKARPAEGGFIGNEEESVFA